MGKVPGTQMTAKGCFSYKNATVNGFNITNQLQVRVEAIDNNVAKIYTTDENGNPMPMPVNVSLRTGVDIMWLHNQKKQAFSASNGITAFSLSAAVKSAYDSAVSASNQAYGIGALDSNGDILLGGNLRISETANIYKAFTTVTSLFVNFTGQHRCFVDAIAPARLRDHEGLVVVTDKNAYASGLLRGRQRAMTINQALPIVSLSKVPKDPRAFGVISLTQDHPAGPSAAISGTELLKIAEQGDVRVQINSVGEGCIWVCDETGSTIHAGDYVTTSSLSGYASLQLLDDGDVPDGTLRNYTVAKLTMDCDFSQPLVDVEEVQKDEYGNVVFDADGYLVYTIVTTTHGPPVVDPDTGETRPGEPLETPILVTEPAYEMRWMTTEIDASSGVSITTLISKEDYETHILLVRSNTEMRGHVTVPASITSIGRFSSYGPSVFHAGAAFSNAPTTFGANIACSSIIDARGGIAVSGFLSNAALTLTDSGGGLALLSAPLHSTQDVHLQKELKVHGNATFDTHVSVNGTLYAKNLHPSFNTFQASNILISQGGIIQFGEGVSSTISFSNAPDTGLFNPVARTLGVVAGGTEMVRVSDTTVSLLGDLVVSSNIVPMTNATQYIGTSNMHFKEAWIDELHISSNTLYIGDTPVLCADNDAVSIRADPGQGITITTTGDGETSLVSAKGVNVVSEGGVTMRVSGPLGRVNIQSSGAGGTVNLGAENEIVMTAPLTTISSNMIVKGDLIVEGTQLTLNTQTVTIEDNIIVLNSEHVMEHWESWDFRPDKDKSKSLDTIQRYFAAADGDSVHVEYAKNKHGRGRLFAKRGLSMQCVMREVRNAVAHPFYVDLDFVNCHPTLFSQRCRKRGVACPLLDQYCGNRTEVLGDIDADAALGKTAVLSVMNGSKTAVYKHQDSVWLRDFQNEMNQARDEIMAPGGADEFYIDIARKDRNTYASAVNLMLCDLENECLMAMLEYLDKKSFKVGVLVFDGAMVEKKKEFADSKDGGVTQEMLDEASDYVWNRTGYRLQIKIKDMTIDMLDVPASAYMGAPVHAPRYAGGDDVAAKILLKDLGGKLVKSKGVVFGKHGDVWTNDKDVVESFMFTACQRANIKFVDESGISRKYSCLYTKAINIVKTAKHYIPVDDNFVKKIWESNLGVLCFRNGVFRFRDKSFAPFSERPEVMPVIVIDRDFPSERPTDELLEHVKEKVLVSTLGEEGRVNTYLQMIARSMAAKHQDKQWGMLIGERNSGKGLLQALNERAWGQYVNTIDSSVLMLNNFTNDVKSQGWMIECEFTRQTYTNEIKVDPGNKHIKLDGGLIKKFQSGGDVLKARQLYENERALKSASRLFMNLNDLPEISAVDALDTVVVIEFPHKFVNPKDVDEAKWLKFFRPADPSLKDGFCAREDVRDAFIWLVIDAFDQEQPLKISDVVRRDTEKLRMDEGDELSLINAHFKITTDLADVVTVADVNEFAKDKKMKTRGLRGRLEKMGAVADRMRLATTLSDDNGVVTMDADMGQRRKISSSGPDFAQTLLVIQRLTGATENADSTFAISKDDATGERAEPRHIHRSRNAS
eukprot:gene31897-biopygen5696